MLPLRTAHTATRSKRAERSFTRNKTPPEDSSPAAGKGDRNLSPLLVSADRFRPIPLHPACAGGWNGIGQSTDGMHDRQSVIYDNEVRE